MLSFTLPVGAALLGFTQLAASASIPSFGFELAKSIPDNGNINHPILEPVFHHITNRHHHMHIRAAEGHGLRYHQKRDNSFAADEPYIAASLDTQWSYPAVVVDHSSQFQNCVCAASNRSMSLTLASASSFAVAHDDWRQYQSLLLVSSWPGCYSGTATQYGYFLASSFVFDSVNRIVHAKGSRISIEDAVTEISLNWGDVEPAMQQKIMARATSSTSSSSRSSSSSSSPSSSSSSSIPKSATPTSTFASASTLSSKSLTTLSASPSSTSSSKFLAPSGSSSGSSSKTLTSSSSSSLASSRSATITSPSSSSLSSSSSSFVSSATITTCAIPTSTMINGLPAASCGSGFDAQLDAILGYFDTDDPNIIDTFFASFAPNTGINYETYLAETNNGTELRRLKRELIRRHKSTASQVFGFIKKDLIQPAEHAAAKGAAKVEHAGKAAYHAAKAVLAKAEKFAKKVAHAAISGYSESVSIDIPIGMGPPSWTLSDSPWGEQFRIFHYEDGKFDSNYNLYAANLATLAGADELIPDINVPISQIPPPSVELFCVGCGIEGKMRTTGSAVFRPIPGYYISNMAISVSGHVTANIALGVNAYMSYVATIASKRLLTVGIPGLSMPGIITVGPILTLDIDAEVNITAQGQLLVGAEYQWPNFRATMDFHNPLKSTSSGFSPITTHTFNASGDLTVATSVGVPVGIGLGIDLLGGLVSVEAAVVDRPAVELVASYSVAEYSSSTSGGGAASGSYSSSTVNGGTCNGIAWYVDLVNTLQLAAGDSKYSLGQWNSPALAQGCLGGVPPSNCSNSGMQWAYFISQNGGDPGSNYTTYDATQFNSAAAMISGNTTTIGGFTVDGQTPSTFYNNPITETTANFAIMHVGYVYAKQSGTYTFEIDGADDIVYIWCGPLAYAGFDSANALLMTTYHNPGVTATMYMVEGTYYPLRVLWDQGGGGGSFAMTITAPDGTSILNSTSPANPYVQQFSCDGTSAPAFPEYQPLNYSLASNTYANTPSNTQAAGTCGSSSCSAPTTFTLSANSGSNSLGTVTYNSGSGHLHLSTAYAPDRFSLSNGYLQDSSTGYNVYLQTGSPGLLYDGSSDPSGDGTLQCIMNCDNTLCCYNAATGANTIAVYCNGDSDDHFYLASSAQASAAGCTPLVLKVSS